MNSEQKTTKTVFVVEDSKDLRELIQLLYEGEGIMVEFAANGLQALEKLRNRSELPGVILLDLMMPQMDGFQFRSEQVKDPKIASIPVLVMTADSGVETKAKQVRAQGYIRKPVDAETLFKVAEKFCGYAS